ncbi:ATP-binding cassette domain-containing protein [Bifidobacterium dolichotidis]|uniref:ATP-binding cassette domain-containing protein n=1 Tax=Bifidobacterium dolichotidis TaxID=2306976 RepID=UPI001F49D875|nr:ABC transporter ATP-binding protein [Bifidobacterium dolichotidis]
MSFGYSKSGTILKNVDLHVEESTIMGLIGPNGSGKTTLINLICDMLEMQQGSMKLQGSPCSSQQAKLAIMHVGSNDDIPVFLTGLEYIQTMARLYGTRVEAAEVAEYFAQFGMAGAERRLIETYSHGMKKKTQLSCAFLLQCPLTIVDETLNGIDIDAWYVCIQEFKKLRAQGCSVLLCSHDFALLEELCDAIALMWNGALQTPLPYEQINEQFGGIPNWYRTAVMEKAI